MLALALRLGTLLLAFSGALGGAFAKDRAGPVAVAAIVSGEKIQKVGFRALVQNLAIQKNLAGFVRNGPDGTVEVRFEGDKGRIESALGAMRRGSKKSSRDNVIRQTPAELTSGLDTFTIFGWTSVSRNISTPYDLVFKLRPDGGKISRKAAKKVWNEIALATLKGDDLQKFKARLDGGE